MAEMREEENKLDALIEKVQMLASKVEYETGRAEQLTETNKNLHRQIDSMNTELQDKQQTMDKKNQTIALLTDNLHKQTISQKDFVGKIEASLKHEAKLVETQYQVDILSSKLRLMERDLTMLRNENERLRRQQPNHR